jgi:multidrug efflux pump subunit AcrA (membrane-fusion protein)
VADPATSTVRVRLELPEGSAGLYPGQFVKVAFTVGDTERLLVPAASIVHRSEVSGVYVVQGKTVSLRQVRLGSRFENDVEVLAGLRAGEQVAVDPVAAGIWIVNNRAARDPAA